ncbi:DUF1926 domain-containing protein [bacterium]|nr:DUF1926 domain-containing protein [bacterium]
MKKINFLFAIHCHQPVGNFDHVFEESFKMCYEPFLDILLRHPAVRCSLHYTGPLYEWIEQNKKDYFDKLRTLVERNQIEILSGGFYEPIITVIPQKDVLEQIQYMNEYIEKNFNQTPRGMWLAERVWEPTLPSLMAPSHMEFSLLDDSHFRYAGLGTEDMFGYYITEDRGNIAKLFPIDINLRYLVPFGQPEEAIEYFKEIASEEPGKAVTLGDDGEKFGIWPNTYKWVYEDKYLEKFFTLLEQNQDWLIMPTFSEYIKQNQSRGKIYLPTSSYSEMMEWALPAKTIIKYEEALKFLNENENKDIVLPFFRGGFWRNFFIKYNESNLMHKKMLWVSNLVEEKASDNFQAKKELWKGQCNCAYWHGLFGGVYLNYLRNAIYTHLINAEKIVEKSLGKKKNYSRLEQTDYCCTGNEDILMSSSIINAYLSPLNGGACFEIDYKPANFNITNTFTRKYEAYHEKLKQSQSNDNQNNNDAPASIHNMVISKESNLDKMLIYDKYLRYTFVDHILPPDTELQDFHSASYKKISDFSTAPYNIDQKIIRTNLVSAILSRKSFFEDTEGNRNPLEIIKEIAITNQNTLSAKYILKNHSKDKTYSFLFGNELNLTYLAANDDSQRYYVLAGGERESMNTMKDIVVDQNNPSIAMVNEWDNIKVEISYPTANELWRFPVETVSQSEGGFEKTYQNSSIMPVRKIKLSPDSKLSFKISLIFNKAR